MSGVLHINGVPVDPPATEFAYDGCHKVYLIRSPEERAIMEGYGYGEDDSDIWPIRELPAVWAETCGLRFISSADLTVRYAEQQFSDDDDPDPQPATVTFE